MNNEPKKSFVELVKNSRDKLIYLITGAKSGNDQWVYICVDPKNHLAFQRDVKKPNFDPIFYGDIICYGEGKSPSEEDKKTLKEYLDSN